MISVTKVLFFAVIASAQDLEAERQMEANPDRQLDELEAERDLLSPRGMTSCGDLCVCKNNSSACCSKSNGGSKCANRQLEAERDLLSPRGMTSCGDLCVCKNNSSACCSKSNGGSKCANRQLETEQTIVV